MSLIGFILVVLFLLLLLGGLGGGSVLPFWGYGYGYGHGGVGVVGFVLIVIVILALMGALNRAPRIAHAIVHLGSNGSENSPILALSKCFAPITRASARPDARIWLRPLAFICGAATALHVSTIAVAAF